MAHPLDKFDIDTLQELSDILDRMYQQVQITSASQIPSGIEGAATLGFKVGQASVATMLREHVGMRMKRAMEN